MKSHQLALFLVGFSVIISVCDAACCSKAWPFTGCYGRGSCNVFCCNCDGGCNYDTKDGHSLNGTTVPDAAQILKEADKNGDHELSFDEAVAYAVKFGKSEAELKKVQTWFTSIDKNHDGKIQASELDASLKH